MSLRFTLAFAACLTLASCGGNPFVAPANPGPGTGPGTGTGTGSTIPDALKGNLQSATYNKAANTLSVAIIPLGGSTTTPATEIVFDRFAVADTNGFQAFRYQETTSTRFLIALFDTSRSGAATAGVSGSGQFTTALWGTTYSANEAFTKPANGGLATYAGRYAGVLNAGPDANPAGTGPGDPFEPAELLRTDGEVMINADFTNNSVEGGIRNRRIINGMTSSPLDDVFLRITAVNPDGSFGGTVVFEDRSTAGTYGGVFAGAGANAVAGAIEIAPDPSNSDLLERGVFVADVCPLTPAPQICP